MVVANVFLVERNGAIKILHSEVSLKQTRDGGAILRRHTLTSRC